MGCVRIAKAALRSCTCVVLLSENVRKYIYMMKKISRRSFLQVCGITAAAAALTACGGTKTKTAKKDDAHEAITFMAPYKEIEAFIEQVHSVYPEVNIEVVPYSGDNTTTCLQNMFAAGDLPDVCTLTYYDPRIDLVSDKLLDLSGYDFTDNYVESRLQDVFDNGAIYLLPSTYNCYGITYNKTLLKKYGWELPNSFAELEELAAKAKEAGVDLCLPQIQYPGYGFQYLCNIADADFLGTLDGRLWQQDYLSGKANVSNTPGMMQAMAYVQKWKDIGMLNDSGDALDDNVTRQRMAEGNTLFLIGNTNGIVEADGNADKFGLMPFLSEDGTQNVFVLNVNRFYGLNKKLEQDPQKLEDALKVMRVLSTVAGTSALQPATVLKSSLLPFKDAKADGTYYADIADALNAGNTAPFIYSGWENTIVTTGLKMLDFIKGDATMEDVIRQLDEGSGQCGEQHPGCHHHRHGGAFAGGLRHAGGSLLCTGYRQRPCAGLAEHMDPRQPHRSEPSRRSGQTVRQGYYGLRPFGHPAHRLEPHHPDRFPDRAADQRPAGFWLRCLRQRQGLPLCAGKPGAAGGGQNLSGGHLRCERPAGCGDHGHRQRCGGHGCRKSLLWRIHHHQPGRYRMELGCT